MVGGLVEPGYREPQPPPGFDPTKWIYDSRTNEFHKVTSRVAGSLLLDSRTYEQRHLAYLIKARDLRISWIVTAIMWAVFLPSLAWSMNTTNGGAIIAVGVFIILPTGAVAALGSVRSVFNSAVTLPMAKANVGPPPPARPGRETVEQQKVHGEGGVLDGDRLRQAARGGSLANEGAAPLETYDD